MIKFYENENTAKLKVKLTTMDVYPEWLSQLSKFCKKWNSDDITQLNDNERINPQQNEILKEVISESLEGKMRNSVYKIKKCG